MSIALNEDALQEFQGFDDRGWICDRCGEPIKRAIDGWVQWRTSEAESRERKRNGQLPFGRDLQLVHHWSASTRPKDLGCGQHGCQFKEEDPSFVVKGLPLQYFLGADGLMNLLEYIAEEEIDRSEILEMIKRMHIPGYEHAHLYFEEAISEGIFEPNTFPGYYSQSNIEAVNNWRKTQEED